MDNIIKYNISSDISKISNKHTKSYSTNNVKNIENDDFFEKIRKLMDDDTIKDFLKKYCDDWSNTKVCFMFINTYLFIEETYINEFNKKLNSYEVIKILKSMFYNVDIRKIMIDSLNNYIEQNKTYKETYITHIKNQQRFIENNINHLDNH